MVAVVLDTNVVLDAWWFADTRATTVVRAVEAGQLQWLATDAMFAEVRDVLSRAAFATATKRCERVLLKMASLALPVPLIAPSAPLRSADPDDQMFLDLALARGARWLFTRDRALLELAPRARAWHCRIVAPQDWPGPAPLTLQPTS